MSRKERSAPSHLRADTVKSPELQLSLTKFSQLFKTCAGPWGKYHLVRNACGGHVTITGCCQRLLSAMMLTRPELKLIASSIQAHIYRHWDGGLFLMTMCSHLILASAQSDLNPSTLTSLFATFSDIIISYLNDPECHVCVRTDFSNLSVLLGYVKSVLSSKPLLALSPANCDHLSQLVLKAFLESIPVEDADWFQNVSDGVYQLTVEDTLIEESKLERGLLLRYPELLAIEGARTLDVHVSSLPSGCGDSTVLECVRVSLFTCSMSGDMEEAVDAHCELTRDQETLLEREAVGSLLRLCDVLGELSIGLVLCQKVIHPKVKAALRSKGIVFVDRLGSQVVPYVQDLTGACPVSSVVDQASVRPSMGWVSTVQHVVLAGKSYLALGRPPASCKVSTLVLCAPLEEGLEELKLCVKASLHGLAQLAQTKTLLLGGGCWQVHCARILQDKVVSEVLSLASAHHCTQSAVLLALAVYRGSLQSWAHSLVAHTEEELHVDPLHHHLWRVPKGWDGGSTPSAHCSCGMKTVDSEDLQTFPYLSKCDTQPYALTHLEKDCHVSVLDSDAECVLDCFSSSVDALKQAVATARLILSISQFISDKN